MARLRRERDCRRLQILAYINRYNEINGTSPADREISDDLQISSTGDIHYHIDQMEQSGWITSMRTETGKRKAGSIRLTEPGWQQLAGYVPNAALQEVFRKLENPPPKQRDNPGDCNKKSKNAPGSQRLPDDGKHLILSARLSNQKKEREIAIRIVNVIPASFETETYSSDYSLAGLDIENLINISPKMIPACWQDENLFALEVRGNSMIDAGIHSGDYVIIRPAETAQDGDMCVVWINEREPTLKYFYREKTCIRLEAANSDVAPRYIGPPNTVRIDGVVVLVVRL